MRNEEKINELSQMIHDLEKDSRNIKITTVKNVSKELGKFMSILALPPLALITYAVAQNGWNNNIPTGYALLATGYTFGVGTGAVLSGYLRKRVNLITDNIETGIDRVNDISQRLKDYRSDLETYKTG